jgi:flavin-dependent dehydrogenase
VANVGVGVNLRFGIKPAKALSDFVRHLQQDKIIDHKIINTTGRAIPVGGLAKKLCCNNILLVGDAAGMAHPITGAGVSNAILCGRMAGEFAAQSAMKNNLDILTGYEEECRMLLGDSLARAHQRRKVMETHWNKNNKDLASILRSTWIAFEEYYK